MSEAVAPIRSAPARLWDAIVGAGPVVVVLLFVLLAACGYAAWRVLDPTPDKHLVIATGPEKGAYIEFARRYRPLLEAQGLTVELRTTQGSSENLALLRDRSSGVQAALVQSGVDPEEGQAADASGKPVIESLGHVAYEPVWLFYREAGERERLRKQPFTRIAQLKGWRVDIGPEGGGSGPLFERLVKANGLEAADLALGHQTPVQGAIDLVAGRTDALLMVAAADSPMVQYLLSTPGVRLFDFTRAEAYSRLFPALRSTTLPRGIADLAADKPPHDIHLVAATASLVVRRDLHPALVQLLLQAAAQVHSGAGWFNTRGEFPNPGASEFSLATEATRFYRDGVPLLQRYLPFWVANFIDRMWIVLLPLLAVMIPLSRVLPPLVTMRLRSRVYRWYANLRAVEQALEQPAPPLGDLREEIDRLDTQVEQVGVPLSFANELYALRTHIQLVRQRIKDRAAA